MDQLINILVGILVVWTILLTFLVILIGVILFLLYWQAQKILKRINLMASEAEGLTMDLRNSLRPVLAGLLIFGLRRILTRVLGRGFKR